MKRRRFIQALGAASVVPLTTIDKSRAQPDENVFEEPARHIPCVGNFDVIVAGAGPAGVAAAVFAARAGARVLLIEVHGCLGGVWTAGQLTWLFEMNKPGFANEIKIRLDQRGARVGKHPERFAYAVEPMKQILDEICREANVSVQLFTRVVAAYKDTDNKLHTLITESKSGRQAWQASIFIDATGDGDLGALAGCGFDIGKPVTGETQPGTLMGMISVKNIDALQDYISFWQGDLKTRSRATKNMRDAFRRAGINGSFSEPTLFHQSQNALAVMFNHEYGLNATDASSITKATMNARWEVNEIVDALRDLGGPWEDIRLISTAEQIGIREGRRLHGLYTITKEDLIEGRRQPDATCTVSFNVDIHSLDPKRGKETEQTGVHVKPYQIPMRALIAEDVNGLLMAGRCISGDFIAHGSYRVTGVSTATGQAAGVAAALASQQNKLPQAIDWKIIETKLSELGVT